MRKVFSIGMLMISPLGLWAQLNNEVFENRFIISETDSSKLFLGLNFLGFGKNNEYFDTTVEGYTLFGYQLNPYLSYHLAPHVRLDAGIYAHKDFGNNEYTSTQPTLSLKIKRKNVAVIFGTLEGSVNHRLIEPLYNFERLLTNRIENGAQFLWMREDLFLDTWVDWNKMIYFNDPEQEVITGGVSFNKRFLSGDFHVDVPLQLSVYHRGGQIDQNPNPVLTTTNLAVGVGLEKEGNGGIKNYGLKSYFTWYNASSDELGFKDGSGLFLNPYVNTSFGLTIMGSYWRGDQYLSKLGGVLYTSIPEVGAVRLDETREWLMLRFLYDINIADGLTLTLRAQPFYDTLAKAVEYSYGFYLHLNNRFFLLHVKK
jgi:hypothetical protein